MSHPSSTRHSHEGGQPRRRHPEGHYENYDSAAVKPSVGRQPLIARLFDDTWAQELLCWLLALISLLVIIIVVAIFNGQPLQKWHSGLTLNTLINVVSQIAQTAVIVPVAASISQLKWIWFHKKKAIGDMKPFDEASRGPISSIMLILKHPSWYLVWLGAVNTTLILLLGPFAQQSVSLPLQNQSQAPGTALMPIKVQYQSFSSSQSLPVQNGGTLDFNTIIPQLQIAAVDGLLTLGADPSAVPPVSGTCVTGNCTFPDYSSLAICSSAEDVTSTLIVDCPRGYPKTESGCTYLVPDLQQAPTWRQDNFTTHGGSLGATLWIGASQTRQDGFPSGPGTLVDFYVLYYDDIGALASDSGKNVTATVVALRGSLNLCVKTHHTTVINGITTTDVTNNQTDLKWQSASTSQGRVISATAADSQNYSLQENTRDYFNAYLSAATFYGEYFGGVPRDPNLNTATSDAARALADAIYTDDPSAVKGLDGVRSLLANVETSMSNALRLAPYTPSATASGTSSSMEVYISVNFGWLVIPILSIVFSFVFLLLVMFETRKKHVPVWKDGQMNTVLAVEPETRKEMEKLVGLTDEKGRDRFREVEVTMAKEGEGEGGKWRLRKST
ncbi:MAG: hypothetical protein Q9214_003960 [Letrouitia sp. 1 TL-2023]